MTKPVWERLRPGLPKPLEASKQAGRAIKLAWEADRFLVIVSFAAQFIVGICTAAQLLLAKQLLDNLGGPDVSSKAVSDLAIPLALLGMVVVLSALATITQQEVTRILVEQVSRRASERIIDVTQSLPLADYEHPEFFDELERATINSRMRPNAAIAGLMGATGGALSLLGVLVALVLIAPLLLPLLLIGSVPLCVATIIVSRKNHTLISSLTPSDRIRHYFMSILTQRNYAQEIRSYQLAEEVRSRFDQLWDERYAALYENAKSRLLVNGVAGILSVSIFVGIALLVIYLSGSGILSLADAAIAVVAILAIGRQTRSMVTNLGRLYEASLFFDDVEIFENRKSQLDKPDKRASPKHSTGGLAVDIKNMEFTYPATEKKVLNRINLNIKSGEIVALVGENGSGKTTLAKLLAGLYKPQSGSISYYTSGGEKVEAAEIEGRITVLFQNFAQYFLSAIDNIGFGRVENIDNTDSIINTSITAGTDDFLKKLPEGYSTPLSKLFSGGTDLSGGQWQRIALARALFRNAELVIMDEPTAALDPRAEHDLYHDMRKLFTGKSVVLITHRFSSVRHADKIYVLQQGEIIESGNHEKLIDENGLYAELFTLQASAYGHTK